LKYHFKIEKVLATAILKLRTAKFKREDLYKQKKCVNRSIIVKDEYRFVKREMEEIKHRTVEVNGIKMHIAEKGEGPVVLFLHIVADLVALIGWYLCIFRPEKVKAYVCLSVPLLHSQNRSCNLFSYFDGQEYSSTSLLLVLCVPCIYCTR